MSDFTDFFTGDLNEPYGSFNFTLLVNFMQVPLKAVHVFKKANEFEYIQEGGLNDYVHMRRKPISQPFTFEVERYVTMGIYDPLALGTEIMLPVFLIVNRDQIEDWADAIGNANRIYIFTGCTVMDKSFGELNSERSALHTETVTIGYRQMLCFNGGGKENLKERYKISDGTKRKTETKVATVPTRSTKTEMIDSAELWEFDKESTDGNPDYMGHGPMSARAVEEYGYTGASKEELIEALEAVRWQFDKTSTDGKPKVEGTGTRNAYAIGTSEENKQKISEEVRKKMMQTESYSFKDDLSKRATESAVAVPKRDTKEQMISKAQAFDINVPHKEVGVNNVGRPERDDKQTLEAAAEAFDIHYPDLPVGINDVGRPEQRSKEEMAAEARIFEMPKDSSVGTRVSKDATAAPERDTKEKKVSAAEKYVLPSDGSVGTRVSRDATKAPERDNKATMTKNAKKWPPTRSARDVSAFLSKKK